MLQRWDIWAPGAVERDMEDDGEFVYADEAIAALAAKDARIKELELKLAQSLNRKCKNCKHTETSVADEPCCNCDQTKSKWEPQ